MRNIRRQLRAERYLVMAAGAVCVAGVGAVVAGAAFIVWILVWDSIVIAQAVLEWILGSR